MKHCLLLLLLLSFNNQAIKTGQYYIDIGSKTVDCKLVLSSDNSYMITLSFLETEDMLFNAVLSQGHYSIIGNQLTLHDDHYGYDWIISIKNNKIQVVQGYVVLNNKKIVDYQDKNVTIISPNEDYLNRNISSIILFIKAQQGTPIIISGQYEDPNQRYLLKIDNKGGYQLYIKDILVSEGGWSQHNNTLMLNDSQLNYSFSMAIGNGDLMSMGIPGEFGGTKFEIIKTNNNYNNKTNIKLNNHRGGCSRNKTR